MIGCCSVFIFYFEQIPYMINFERAYISWSLWVLIWDFFSYINIYAMHESK